MRFTTGLKACSQKKIESFIALIVVILEALKA